MSIKIVENIKSKTEYIYNVFKPVSIKKHKNTYLFPQIDIGSFTIKLAETKLEIKKAQSLRYEVFFKEKNVKPSMSQKILRRDFDKYDKISDHLIIVDNKNKSNNIVGTYRLLNGKKAKETQGFYSETEFNITNIKTHFLNDSILELGRSCIHPSYRSGIILKLLWYGIAKYIKNQDIKLLIGCVSFSSINLNLIKEEIKYLQNNHTLPDQWMVKSKQNNKILFNGDNIYCNEKVFNKLPPLLKGYLKMGGMVSDEYYIDYQFKTIDCFIAVFIDQINKKYKNKFLN